MPRIRFPFPLGSEAAVVVVPPAEPTFWTNITAASLNWVASRGGRLPRFEHIYPQESGAEQQWSKVQDPD